MGAKKAKDHVELPGDNMTKQVFDRFPELRNATVLDANAATLHIGRLDELRMETCDPPHDPDWEVSMDRGQIYLFFKAEVAKRKHVVFVGECHMNDLFELLMAVRKRIPDRPQEERDAAQKKMDSGSTRKSRKQSAPTFRLPSAESCAVMLSGVNQQRWPE